jgi:hypothetical protein
MEIANTDTTYCKGKNCKEKCWRHVSHYCFEADKDYWLMKKCKEVKKKC